MNRLERVTSDQLGLNYPLLEPKNDLAMLLQRVRPHPQEQAKGDLQEWKRKRDILARYFNK